MDKVQKPIFSYKLHGGSPIDLHRAKNIRIQKMHKQKPIWIFYITLSNHHSSSFVLLGWTEVAFKGCLGKCILIKWCKHHNLKWSNFKSEPQIVGLRQSNLLLMVAEEFSEKKLTQILLEKWCSSPYHFTLSFFFDLKQIGQLSLTTKMWPADVDLYFSHEVFFKETLLCVIWTFFYK